jgi:hypothetical protein
MQSPKDADSRPNRKPSLERQLSAFDPESVYVPRVIPELGTPDYPSPMVMAV